MAVVFIIGQFKDLQHPLIYYYLPTEKPGCGLSNNLATDKSVRHLTSLAQHSPDGLQF